MTPPVTPPVTPQLTPQQRAEKVGEIMYAADTTAQDLGIRLLSIAPGRARMGLAIVRTMTNGLSICHGGYIFLLADTTFAYACNSHNFHAVAASAQIDFLAPAHCDDYLTAEAVEQQVAGRTGVYDIRVTNQSGTTIALFRGKSALIKGRFFEEPEA